MKLLLTSAGITNKSIENSLVQLIGKPVGEASIAIIPTAANVEEGDKGWFFGQFAPLFQVGFASVDFVDFTAPDCDWRSRLDTADILFVSGGNTYYLLDQARKTGFDEWLLSVLEEKVYVGVSAGSILVCPTIEVAGIEPGDPNLPGLTDLTGLGVVDFWLEPHCDEARFEVMKRWSEDQQKPLYALDDESALQVTGAGLEVISDGRTEASGVI